MYVEDKLTIKNEQEVSQDHALKPEDPMLMEEFDIEELSVDGICGVY
jgi:mycofactocin precursor